MCSGRLRELVNFGFIFIFLINITTRQRLKQISYPRLFLWIHSFTDHLHSWRRFWTWSTCSGCYLEADPTQLLACTSSRRESSKTRLQRGQEPLKLLLVLEEVPASLSLFGLINSFKISTLSSLLFFLFVVEFTLGLLTRVVSLFFKSLLQSLFLKV